MSAPMTTVELIERVVRLEAQQAPLEVLATEMLSPLLEALDARAGALLCYRRDEGALALAAGRGLTASTAEQLATLRWGGGGASEMPLRALVDRKVYQVDAALLRPFTADLAEESASIAAIPLHRWHQPVAVLLAIADHLIAPERILEHQLAYEVVALALAAALWGGPRAASFDVAAAPPPALVCEAWADVGVRVVQGIAGGESGVIDAMLRDLRGAVEALRSERRLEEAERVALAERLAAAERERAQHAARTAALERELERHTTLLSQAREDRDGASADGRTGADGEAAATLSGVDGVSEAASPDGGTALAGEAMEVAATENAATDASSTARQPAPRAHRVLDPDAARRDAIAAALASQMPNPPPAGVVVENLYHISDEMLIELTAAATSGAALVAYAADGDRSRILGGVRCFVEPPAPGEITAALESQPRAGRRLISLSDDIDAFIPAKIELAKLGYSVSMACDDKQAVDLLALLNPDAVLVDLRKTPEAAATFIDALTPESGRMLTILVHGAPERGTLRRGLERLMRPAALEANDLARVSRTVATSTPITKAAGVSAIRSVERIDAAPRRAGARA